MQNQEERKCDEKKMSGLKCDEESRGCRPVKLSCLLCFQIRFLRSTEPSILHRGRGSVFLVTLTPFSPSIITLTPNSAGAGTFWKLNLDKRHSKSHSQSICHWKHACFIYDFHPLIKKSCWLISNVSHKILIAHC